MPCFYTMDKDTKGYLPLCGSIAYVCVCMRYVSMEDMKEGSDYLAGYMPPGLACHTIVLWRDRENGASWNF